MSQPEQHSIVLPPFVYATTQDYWAAHPTGIEMKPAPPKTCQKREQHAKMMRYSMELDRNVCLYCNPQWATDRGCLILEWLQEDRRGLFLFLLHAEQEARRQAIEREQRTALIAAQRRLATQQQ